MAASMTDLASRFESVGFLTGRFFFGLGFGMGASCHIQVLLSAPTMNPNHTSTECFIHTRGQPFLLVWVRQEAAFIRHPSANTG